MSETEGVKGKLYTEMWKQAEANGWQEAGFYCLTKDEWEEFLDLMKADFPKPDYGTPDYYYIAKIKKWKERWLGQ